MNLLSFGIKSKLGQGKDINKKTWPKFTGGQQQTKKPPYLSVCHKWSERNNKHLLS